MATEERINRDHVIIENPDGSYTLKVSAKPIPLSDYDSDSILLSIKKLLGIAESDTYFDPDIVLHINSVLSVLCQLGVGPTEGFSIVDGYDRWEDFIADDPAKLQMVKTYVGLKVKLYFDPPINSSILAAYERQITELEWRLNVQVDPGEKDEQ